MSRASIANPDQSVRWNDRTGRTWAELGEMLDRLLEPFVPLVLREIEPLEGRRILDVGCGAGALALAAAERGAEALGIDISAPLIEAARARAERSGIGAEFVQADAQSHRFDPPAFDALVSRFGVMFFADPREAFRNLRSAVRPGGKLACLAWRGPDENGFMTAAERAAADLLPRLPERVENEPGQFGFADSGHVRSILAQAGWRDVAIRPADVECSLPEKDLRVYIRRMGLVADQLPALDDSTRAEVERRIDSAFDPYLRNGEARFTAACWLVTARA
ncbi:MAG TPA: methyltransferase domain-containing protein [Allosphingosinicella sp.]|nr:methyltransferase domain-containing protein [Allosphingosinicella sp.]